MTSAPPITTCALCALDVGSQPVCADELAFCCHGCHTVYEVLKRTGELDAAEASPIFQQAVQSGLISNPALLQQLRTKERPEELKRITIEISEMWCPSCAEIIRLLLLQREGVYSCVVDYATDLASIEYDPLMVGEEALFSAIRSLGYGAHRLDAPEARRVNRSLLLRFGVAAFCTLNIMMFSYPLYAGDRSIEQTHFFAWLSLVVALPVVTYSLQPILRRFWNSLKVALFGMETLVVIGVTSAFSLSLYNLSRGSIHVYFDSLSAIVTLVLLGKIIESRAKFSARSTLKALTHALPRRARRCTAGVDEWIPVKEVRIGDLLYASAGERIVLDGEVVEGEGSVDESLLTGEAIPIRKTTPDTLVAGSVLTEGWLRYRVTQEERGSTLMRVVSQVEQGLSHKPAYTRAVDPIVRWLVPAILLLAAATFLFTGDPIRAISILLISCPCAIGIAAPLAESLTMSALAREGAIVRNRGVLQLLGRETRWVFDKTGTLTHGNFSLMTKPTIALPQLKALVSASQHPISRAIDRELNVDSATPTTLKIIVGKGVEATFSDATYRIGSSRFMRETDVQGNLTEPHGVTPLYFSRDDQLLQRLDLGDTIREEARDVVAQLPFSTIVSGDAKPSVASVAGQLGDLPFHARQNPVEKQQLVRSWRDQGDIVAMIGDGINDAPALSQAHIAISVLAASDIAAQSSDLLLTTPDLSVLPRLRAIAKHGRRIVTQNLFWAFAYNIVGVGLAVAGMLQPLYAAVAMILSSLAVTLNARRM